MENQEAVCIEHIITIAKKTNAGTDKVSGVYLYPVLLGKLSDKIAHGENGFVADYMLDGTGICIGRVIVYFQNIC